MGTDNLHRRVERFFQNTAGSYDQVVFWTTLGQDVLWKRQLLSLAECPAASPRYILDLACGTGILTMKLARKFPQATVVGIDLTPAYLALAISKAQAQGLERRIRYYEMAAEDALELPYPTFDLVISSYLPKYTDVTALGQLTNRLLTNHNWATAVYHDFAQPHGLFRLGYEAYWLGLKPFLRLVGWGTVSQELKELIRATDHWPQELAQSLADNGLTETKVFECPGRYAAIVRATRGGHG